MEFDRSELHAFEVEHSIPPASEPPRRIDVLAVGKLLRHTGRLLDEPLVLQAAERGVDLPEGQLLGGWEEGVVLAFEVVAVLLPPREQPQHHVSRRHTLHYSLCE